MRINNIDSIDKDKLYYCYSTKLYKYLLANNTEPIRVGFDNNTGKFMGIFIKSKKMCNLLTMWSDAKERGERLIE